KQFFDYHRFGLCLLGTSADFFLQTVQAFLQRREIGQDQLGIDDLDVTHRIDRPTHVVDVAAFETANDLNNRVDLADMTEELVAETFARTSSLHQPSDVDE